MIRIRTQFSAVARRRSLVSGLFAAVLASAILPAHAQTEDAAARAAERARAEALEADGKALRAEAEATYEATVPGCYDRFFVNRCIDQAKKKRLETVKRARELEAESRRITLAERQRVAAEAGAKAERPLTPATPTALPATSPAAVSAPSPDTRIAPSPEAERIRAEREAATRAAETQAARSRAANDAQRAADRRQAETDAASRAQQAAEDRARYDERIRKYEEEQAKKKQ
jgi:hypothetical protein